MKTPTIASPRALTALRRALERHANADVPRYVRLRDALIATIESGSWKAGERLPTETELCKAVPYSLGTVQRALRALVDEGVVNRVQGSGTFVATSHGKIDDVVHCRFRADDGVSFLPVYSRVLSRRAAKGAGPWQAYFGSVGAQPLCLDRILNVNGEFNVYSRFYFDGARFKTLATGPYSALAGANLKELLRDELHIPRMDLDQTFHIAPIPPAICAHIGVAPDTIGGILEGVGRTRGSDVVYFQQMFFPPSQRRWVPYAGTSAE